MAVLSFITIIALVFAGVAFQQKGQADAKTEEALARSLASQSEQMRGIAGSLTGSVLLAVESLGHKETLEGNAALRRGLALLPRCIAQLKHNGSINVVAFSPDGGKLATGSIDGLARLWDVETGKELQRLEHDGWVSALAFSSDGSRLATGSGDKTARIWTLDIKKIMEEACSRVTRNMTREEWGRFIDDPDSDCLICPREGKFNRSGTWPWERRECQPCVGSLG